MFLSYGVLNDVLTNPGLVREWFTTTLVSRTGPGLASKGLIFHSTFMNYFDSQLILF